MTEQERLDLADRIEVANQELRILGQAIRSNWGTASTRQQVQTVIESICSFVNGQTDICQESRIFYHYNNTVDCGSNCCKDWICPICEDEGRYRSPFN